MKTNPNSRSACDRLHTENVFFSPSPHRVTAVWLTALLLACSIGLPSAARAFQVRGIGASALDGNDLTDPENDGDPANLTNYNATFSASEESNFSGTGFNQGAFNVFDNRLGNNGDKWCCGTENNFPTNPIFIDATFPAAHVLRRFTLASGEDAPDRDPLVWKIQGSNDGVNFTDIYSRNNPTTSVWTARSQVVAFVAGIDYALPPAYTTIRFICTATGSSDFARYQLGEIEYLETGASLVVTTTTDEDNGTSDPTQGTGTSLREALIYANTLSGPQTITFSNSTAFGAVNFHDGTARTITIATNPPTIAGDLTLTGPGAKSLTVTSANLVSSSLRVGASAKGTFSGLTIEGLIGISNLGTATVRDCFFNASRGIEAPTASSRTSVAYSTFSGGNPGLANNAGTATISNCTFSGNSEGILHQGGTTTVTNCTISGNMFTGIRYNAGGIPAFTLRNTICAGNGTNTSGSFVDGGNNILTGTAADAGLDPNGLQNNGGPTDTIKLIPGSPAIDGGNNSLALDGDGNALPTDQRGAEFDRVIKGKSASANPIVDIGAFEVQVITFAPGVATNGVQLDANDAPLDLTGMVIGATPAGGTFSGSGVDANGLFHPELLDPGTYTITYTTTTPDAFGNTGSATFTITITAQDRYLRLIADVVPGGLGIDVPNEPAGTKFTQLGLASMNGGAVGGRVRIKPPAGAEVPAIFYGNAASAADAIIGASLIAPGGILARGGQAAPSAAGGGATLGTFASFNEPVFGGIDVVAFGATITGAGVSKTNDTGLWSTVSGQLALVAGEGGAAPDANGVALIGAVFDKIQSYALSADGEALSFVATLKGPSVNGTNKTGVWQHRTRFDFMSSPLPPSTKLIFRTGDEFFVTTDFKDPNNLFDDIEELRPVKSLKLFVPAKTIPGQRRSYGSESGHLFAFAKFAAGREALLGWTDNGFFFFTKFLALENTTVGHPGVPSINNNGNFAMRAGLSTGAVLANNPNVKITGKNDQTILTGRNQFNLGILCQEGSPVSSTNPEVFTAFDEPAFNDNFRTAFFAKVKAPGLPASQQRVLIYEGGPLTNFEPAVIARTGSAAPDQMGALGTAVWKEFTAMALPDSDYGPVFLAKLSGPGVTPKNNIGLWATDLDGSVRLLLRTGDMVSVNGVNKTVSLINTLGAALDSPGQGRYVDLLGNVSATLTFTDGTTALVHFGMPTVK